MGIYLPNMEMPRKGQMLVIFPDGTSYVCFNGMRERLAQTEAVPVQPHGRLIDAAARVNVQLYNDEFEDYQTVNMSIDDLLDSSWIEFEDDPTIIPAEEGEA